MNTFTYYIVKNNSKEIVGGPFGTYSDAVVYRNVHLQDFIGTQYVVMKQEVTLENL